MKLSEKQERLLAESLTNLRIKVKNNSGKIRKVTHANLSKLPPPLVHAIALLVQGGAVVGPGSQTVRIVEARPYGHIAAVLGYARKLGLPALLHARPSRARDLALTLVVLRLLEPGSRLAAARKLEAHAEMAGLNEALGLGAVSEQHLYNTLDWLAGRQAAIEAKLARRHLRRQLAPLLVEEEDRAAAEQRRSICPLRTPSGARGRRRTGRRYGTSAACSGSYALCSATGCASSCRARRNDRKCGC